MGQLPLSGTIDTTTDTLALKCHSVFDQCRDELLISGPLKGWKFAKTTYHGVDVNQYTITGFAYDSPTTTTVSAAHALSAGEMVTISGTTNYNGTYKVESVSTTVSFVITKAYVANDATGTAQWTSNDYAYRYAVPTCLKVIKASVGGIELPDWVREGDWILTNLESSEIDITIIKVITDVTLLPVWFVKVLALKIAIELTYNITQDYKQIQFLSEDLDLSMDKAIAMDEAQKYAQEYSSSWVDAGRNGNAI